MQAIRHVAGLSMVLAMLFCSVVSKAQQAAPPQANPMLTPYGAPVEAESAKNAAAAALAEARKD